jgi:hypothetical protein
VFDIENFLDKGLTKGGHRSSKFEVFINEDDDFCKYRIYSCSFKVYNANFVMGKFIMMEDEDFRSKTFLDTIVNKRINLNVNFFGRDGTLLETLTKSVFIGNYELKLDWSKTDEITEYEVSFES